uniref:Uncharacterized protein n=1 Tax=Steinernema glaseri TaxID=37863 RepID=A0A1I7Y671_9BILA
MIMYRLRRQDPARESSYFDHLCIQENVPGVFLILTEQQTFFFLHIGQINLNVREQTISSCFISRKLSSYRFQRFRIILLFQRFRIVLCDTFSNRVATFRSMEALLLELFSDSAQVL